MICYIIASPFFRTFEVVFLAGGALWLLFLALGTTETTFYSSTSVVVVQSFSAVVSVTFC